MKKNIKKISLILYLAVAVLFFVGALGDKAYAADVGQQLLQPEEGWQRIDDSNELISFNDFWNSASEQDPESVYKGTWHYTKADTVGSEMKFRFKGEKFRIIGACNNGIDNSFGSQYISVNVDGKEYKSMSCFNNLTFKCMLYDLEGLDNEIHTVTLTNKTAYFIWFDAIDIDKDGCMLNVDKKYVNSINLSENSLPMNIGESKVLTSSVMPENAENKSITWTSSDDNVCTVDQDGKVTAVSSGKAAITVVANDGSGRTASCNVTVVDNRPGVLTVNMVNGRQYTYDMTMDEINTFTTWYDNRSEGIGKSYYVVKTKPSSGESKMHTDYLSFNNISDFSIDMY